MTTLGFRWRSLVAGMALGLGLAACGHTHDPLPDKNTNWLRSCDSDAECGALACVCGVCTIVCARAAECADFGDDAVCGEVSDCSERTCRMQGDTEPERADAAVGMTETATPDAGTPDSGNGSCNGPCVLWAQDGGRTVDPPPPNAGLPETDSRCAEGWFCEPMARLQAPNDIRDVVVDDDGSVYFTDWGSTDDMGNYAGDGRIWRIEPLNYTYELVRDNLIKPWRLWLDADNFYFLGGDHGDWGVGPGTQTLYSIPRDRDEGPFVLSEGRFDYIDMQGGHAYWLSTEGDQLMLHSWQAGTEVIGSVAVAGADASYHTLAGIDQDYVYLEDGGSQVLRVDRATESVFEPLALESPIFLTTVGPDALWAIHTDADNRDWVASVPKQGGAVTNVTSADGYYDQPQPGSSLVWFVTGEQNTSTWQLWAAPKTGGEREPIYRFATESGVVREDAPAPVWAAQNDDAWVADNGVLVHVHRLETP